MNRQTIKLSIALAIVAIVGSGCTSKEDAAERYLTSGKNFFKIEKLKKANLELV